MQGSEEKGGTMGLFSNLISFGTGYALGAQKGYEPIKTASRRAVSTISGKIPRLGTPTRDGDDFLDVREVREVMTAAPRTVEATAGLADAAQIMREDSIGDVIVTDGDRPIGIITDRDIAVNVLAAGTDPSRMRVRDLIQGELGLVTIAPTETVQEAMRRMGQQNIRRLPVVESDRVVGIVSLGDVSQLPGAGAVLADVSNAPPNS
jgi:CBS domain-containing protein